MAFFSMLFRTMAFLFGVIQNNGRIFFSVLFRFVAFQIRGKAAPPFKQLVCWLLFMIWLLLSVVQLCRRRDLFCWSSICCCPCYCNSHMLVLLLVSPLSHFQYSFLLALYILSLRRSPSKLKYIHLILYKCHKI